MSVKQDVLDYLDAHLDYPRAGESHTETARRLIDDGVTDGAERTVRRWVSQWSTENGLQGGESTDGGCREVEGRDEPQDEDPDDASGDSYDWTDTADGVVYYFDIKGYSFEVSGEDVQQWVRWYVYDGCRVTQRGITRMAWQEQNRRLTKDFVRRIFTVLGVTKDSPPFAPHLLAKYTPDELAKLHFSQAQADAEMAVREQEIKEWRRRYRKIVQQDARIDEKLERIAERVDSSKVSIVIDAPEWDQSLDPYQPIFLLSDWHIGAVVDLPQNDYNQHVARRRIDAWKRRVDEWMDEHRRPVERAHVAVLGDLLDGPNGNMHPGQQASQDLFYDEQTDEAGERLADCLSHLRSRLGHVPMEVTAVGGNHGRSTKSRKDDPARVIELATYRIAKEIVDDLDIEWNISREMATSFTAYSTQVIVTHGDEVPSKDDKVIRALMDKRCEWHLLLRGHRHCSESGEAEHLDGLGVQCGSLIGDTDHARQKLAVGARPSQRIVKVTKRGPKVPGTLLVG